MLPFVLATAVVVAFVQLFCLVLCVVYRHSKFNSRPPLVGVCVCVDVAACKICSCLQHTPNTPQPHTHAHTQCTEGVAAAVAVARKFAASYQQTNWPNGPTGQQDSWPTGGHFHFYCHNNCSSILVTRFGSLSLSCLSLVAIPQAGSHRFQCPLCLHLVRPMKPHECKTMTFNASCKAINLRYLRL